MARILIPPGGEGPANEGERRVIHYLAQHLPEDWTIYPNIEIPQPGRPTTELDALVVGTHAVYAIEIKDRRIRISGDEREWLISGRSTERSPLLVVRQKARVVKSIIQSRVPALARAWVEGVVVFASDPLGLDLTPAARSRCLLLREAVPFLLDPAALNQIPNAIRALDEPIRQAIEGRSKRRDRVLRFGSFRVLETLSASDEQAEYRARNDDMPNAPEVRLKVVTVSPYALTPQQQTQRKAELVRDAEALYVMGSHPNVEGARHVFHLDDKVVVVLPLEPGRSLRQTLLLGTPLTVEQKCKLLTDVVRGLRHAHAHGVIHRNLSPSSIFIGDDGVARLTDFSLAKLEGAAQTVWVGSAVERVDAAYQAPELLTPELGPPSPVTDLFSVGVVAWELFAGAVPFSHPAEVARGVPARPDAMPGALGDVVGTLLQYRPEDRTATDDGVLAATQSCLLPDQPSLADGVKLIYDVGDLIDEKYEVRQVLGGGGFSTVYRCYWPMGDCERAIKVFKATGGNDFEAAQREVKALLQIDHPNVVRVFHADVTSSGQWYLVNEYVPGEPLTEFGVGGTKRLSVGAAIDVGLALLRALESVHPNEPRIADLEARGELDDSEQQELDQLRARGLIHRDVKPHNVLLTRDRGPVLIDFNIASPAGAAANTDAGTRRYTAPDVPLLERWTTSVDLFGLGVTLYELITLEHPYPLAVPTLHERPIDPRTFRSEISEGLATFLMRACAPTSGERFATAFEMFDALESIGELFAPPPPQAPPGLPPEFIDLLRAAPPNTNPFVTELLALGAQARRTNRATRGLTTLARLTYVETLLDRELAASVLDGAHELVIITGNAGDGKTAFIQQVEATAKERGAITVAAGVNGGRYRYLGRELETLYDGSQDEGDRTSDQVLDDFLGTYAIGGASDGVVRVAAINEGRLRDFILGRRAHFPRLVPLISALDDPAAPASLDGIAIVNLNLRSVTRGGRESIFTRQVDAIVNGPFWSSCDECVYRARCPIVHNIDTLSDPASGTEVVERLRRLVDVVRLRRRRHLTMRDVRSLIASILFRDRDCHEIAEVLRSDDPMAIVDLTYFQGIAGAGTPNGSAADRGVELLREVDVGAVANPIDDRQLASGEQPVMRTFDRRPGGAHVEALLNRARLNAGSGYDADTRAAKEAHQAVRRRVFFERADDDWWNMLPHSQLMQLETALNPVAVDERGRLLAQLIQAISASEGQFTRSDALWLATSSVDASTEYRGYRRVPVSEFELRPAQTDARYVEAEPDHLELVHVPSSATLLVDIDLLEVLERLREGAVPSIEESRGILVNLDLFKSQLLATSAQSIYLSTEDGPDYRIRRTADGRISLEVTG